MKKFLNKADLGNVIVQGGSLLYPRKAKVLIGDTKGGYELGDLLDANAIVDVVDSIIDEGGDIETLKEAIADEVSSREALEDRVERVDDSLSTLEDNTYTKSETTKVVADEIAKVVADAPESLDTLKEISDWISGHEDDAAAMNSAIQTNKSSIESLGSAVSALSGSMKTVSQSVSSLRNDACDNIETDNNADRVWIEWETDGGDHTYKSYFYNASASGAGPVTASDYVNFSDKYTQSEIDTKLSALLTALEGSISKAIENVTYPDAVTLRQIDLKKGAEVLGVIVADDGVYINGKNVKIPRIITEQLYGLNTIFSEGGITIDLLSNLAWGGVLDCDTFGLKDPLLYGATLSGEFTDLGDTAYLKMSGTGYADLSLRYIRLHAKNGPDLVVGPNSDRIISGNYYIEGYHITGAAHLTEIDLGSGAILTPNNLNFYSGTVTVSGSFRASGATISGATISGATISGYITDRGKSVDIVVSGQGVVSLIPGSLTIGVHGGPLMAFIPGSLTITGSYYIPWESVSGTSSVLTTTSGIDGSKVLGAVRYADYISTGFTISTGKIDNLVPTIDARIANVIADAPSDFDTLKEIADWIDGHENSASAMKTAISGIKIRTDDLESRIDGLELQAVPVALDGSSGQELLLVEPSIPVDEIVGIPVRTINGYELLGTHGDLKLAYAEDFDYLAEEINTISGIIASGTVYSAVKAETADYVIGKVDANVITGTLNKSVFPSAIEVDEIYPKASGSDNPVVIHQGLVIEGSVIVTGNIYANNNRPIVFATGTRVGIDDTQLLLENIYRADPISTVISGNERAIQLLNNAGGSLYNEMLQISLYLPLFTDADFIMFDKKGALIAEDYTSVGEYLRDLAKNDSNLNWLPGSIKSKFIQDLNISQYGFPGNIKILKAGLITSGIGYYPIVFVENMSDGGQYALGLKYQKTGSYLMIDNSNVVINEYTSGNSKYVSVTPISDATGWYDITLTGTTKFPFDSYSMQVMFGGSLIKTGSISLNLPNNEAGDHFGYFDIPILYGA